VTSKQAAPRAQPKSATPRTEIEKAASKQKPKKTPNDFELNIAHASFISVEGDSSKATSLGIKPTTMETTGMIILDIKSSQQPLLVELLSKGNVVSKQPGKKRVTFTDLPPGEYTLRVIVDNNHDNRWSPGNIFQNRPPEPIHFYLDEDGKSVITLKANWERELLITF
jgi:hypothetical protein